MKSKTIILSLLGMMLVVLSIGIGSAYKSHEVDTNLSLVIQSPNATACNVTYIQKVDGTLDIINLTMDKNGNTFNRTILDGNFTKVGDVCFGITCYDGSTFAEGTTCREITITGNPRINEGEGISLAISVIVMLVVGIVFLLLGFKTEASAFKIILVGISGIVLFSAILYSVVILHQNLGGYGSLINSYSSFLMVMRFVVSIGILALLMVGLYLAWNFWQYKRGFKD